MNKPVEGRVELAQRFIEDALLPFLFRKEGNSELSTDELGALLWGFQIGTGEAISPFELARALRDAIRSATSAAHSVMEGASEVAQRLVLMDEALPKIVFSFTYKAAGRSS